MEFKSFEDFRDQFIEDTKEPVPVKGMPTCPEWLLSETKKEWDRLADLMNQMGVLSEVDMAAFAAYCQSYARLSYNDNWKYYFDNMVYWVGILLGTN